MSDYMGQDVHVHMEMFRRSVAAWNFWLQIHTGYNSWFFGVYTTDDDGEEVCVASGSAETLREAFLNCRASFEKYKTKHLDCGDE